MFRYLNIGTERVNAQTIYIESVYILVHKKLHISCINCICNAIWIDFDLTICKFVFLFSERIYYYQCPNCPKNIREKLIRHLELDHNKEKEEELTKAHRMLQTKMRVIYQWCQDKKHGTPLPLPCELCSTWFTRLDHHLSNQHKG